MLQPCRECRKKVSTEAATCPHCGVSNPAPPLPPAGLMSFLIPGAVGLLLFLWFAGLFDRQDRIDQGQATVANPIAYTMIEESAIPNGGYFRSIVVSPEVRTDSALEKLGRQLAAEASNARNAHIEVFDDVTAASNRDAMTRDALSPAELAHYDQRVILFYDKNGNTGFNSITITVDGVSESAGVRVIDLSQ